MKKQLLVAITTGLIASSAMAQSAFEGFYAQAGIGYENNTLNSNSLNILGLSNPAPSASSGGFSGVLGLGYNLSVAPQWVIGVGADYSPTSLTSSNQLACNSCAGSFANFKVSNRYSIFVAPGYQIDKSSLAYVKAGYSAETVNWQPQGNSGQSNASMNASGFVVGLGYKQLIDKNLYVFGEGNYYSYSSVNGNSTGGQPINVSTTPSAAQLLVGMGYKF
ncbi:porin family protein [Polynucleobacter paneuropaeus]|nr:porin family protein [Polynucleobacter paneuropaeus]